MVERADLGQPLGHQQYTVTTPAFGLTNIPAGASKVVLQAEAQSLRWRDDGTDPTTTVGMVLAVETGAGASPPLDFEGKLGALRFIQTAAGAILNVAFYR